MLLDLYPLLFPAVAPPAPPAPTFGVSPLPPSQRPTKQHRLRHTTTIEIECSWRGWIGDPVRAVNGPQLSDVERLARIRADDELVFRICDEGDRLEDERLVNQLSRLEELSDVVNADRRERRLEHHLRTCSEDRVVALVFTLIDKQRVLATTLRQRGEEQPDSLSGKEPE